MFVFTVHICVCHPKRKRDEEEEKKKRQPHLVKRTNSLNNLKLSTIEIFEINCFENKLIEENWFPFFGFGADL